MVRLWQCLAVVGGLASGVVAGNAQAPLSGSGSTDEYNCNHVPYKMHIFSKSPLVIYIEDFLTSHERAHLQDLAKGSFKHSAVAGSSSKGNIHSVRTSQSTSIQRDDVVRCIEARALAFQGLDAEDAYTSSRLEPVQLVKYAATEHFHYHTDWFTDPAHAAASLGGNRQSSFFAYVKADNVTGGGTNFPLLDAPGRRAEDGGEGWWCRAGFLDCDAEYEDGVTFRPVEGNAVFWANLHEGGQGDGRTLHAGLPLVAGEKIGMNIWTRQAALPAEVRGE